MAVTINASTTTGLVQTADTSGVLQLQTNSGTTAVTIDTSQNVGIGTASPSQRLQVDSTGATSTVFSRNGGTNANTNVQFKNSTTSFYLGTNSSGNFAIKYNDPDLATSPNIVIDSSGNVLVGTTTSFNARLNIAFTGADCITTRPTTNTAYSAASFQNSSASFVGAIAVGTSSTAYQTSSDYRLKENIEPMTGALAKVQQLKPVTYTWKSDGSDGQGFIAHELQAIVPDCVVGEKDDVETYTDEDGIEQTRIKPQGVDTSFLVATLTAAIQEQTQIINDLTARITALEGAA
jgi:hypothetical protein